VDGRAARRHKAFTNFTGIKPLPTSLDDALQALIEDHEFLLAGDVFSEELIENWIEHKREVEYYPVRNRPHPYEMSLYFDV
jgi:glutamine synthetase